jgi:hypothetical protein
MLLIVIVSVIGEGMSVENWWSVTDGGETVYLGGEPVPLSVRATWSGLGLNLRLRSERPATNQISVEYKC